MTLPSVPSMGPWAFSVPTPVRRSSPVLVDDDENALAGGARIELLARLHLIRGFAREVQRVDAHVDVFGSGAIVH
jgi:hypothetical protein